MKPGWQGNSLGWKQSKHSLDNLGNPSQVQFRFVFSSATNPFINDGYSIDDFSVTSALQKDAAILSLTNITPAITTGSLLDLKINLHNSGYTPTNTVNIYYSINNGSFINSTWATAIDPDSSVAITLTQLNPIGGQNNIRVYITMNGDLNHYNDTLDISFYAQLLAPFPYVEPFENANTAWLATPSTLGSTSWEWGSPAFGATNSVHAGSYCWDINLTTPYGLNVNTKLLSPIFDCSFLNPMELRAWVNYNTEHGGDGVRLMYTFDAINFQPLGVFNDPNAVNWYNAANVTGLNGPGWTGNSLGWKEIVYTSNAFYGHPFVQFRFDFKSDLTLSGDGFSLDDFSLSGTIGIGEQDGDAAILVYPNPVGDKLSIVFAKAMETQVNISLLTMAGAKVFLQTIKVVNDKIELDLDKVIAGIYILQITANEKVYYRKITKILH